MKLVRSMMVAGVASALAAAGAGAEVVVVGNQGPSSSATPYVVPVAAGVRTISILTAGDSVNPKLDGVTPYRMVGIPDGLGAIDAGDGTMLVTVNHEINAASGVARAHGSAGGFISAWKIDRATLAVASGYDLVRTVETWNSATQSFVQGPTAFDRPCSADVPAPGAFFDPVSGLGTTERFHVNGEESGNGRAFANQVTGVNTGVSWELPRLGRQAWENVIASPFAQEKTVVAAIDDTTPGQVFVYVGTKLATGNDVQKAGLLNGTLYGVIANGALSEDRLLGIGLAKGVAGAFTLAALPDQSAAGANTETAANAALVTRFLRPEDGAWDPLNPADFWFVTTDQFDQVKSGSGATVGRTRLWRLRFSDITNPVLGGSVTMMLDGTEPGQMYDNICVDRAGHVLLQEDVGNNAHSGKIWQYDIASGALKLLAKHDAARFGDRVGGVSTPATAPFSADEESSGIIDASDLLGQGWFLLDVQAHYAIAGELFQGGQLLALYNPDSAPFSAFDVEVKLEFKDKGNDDHHDEIEFECDVPVPSGFDPSGKTVSIDVGGVKRAFTLASNGQAAGIGPESCRLDVKKTGGSVLAQNARLSIEIRGAGVETGLTDEGLTDADAEDKAVVVTAVLKFDGRVLSQDLHLTYDAEAGKKGEAK